MLFTMQLGAFVLLAPEAKYIINWVLLTGCIIVKVANNSIGEFLPAKCEIVGN